MFAPTYPQITTEKLLVAYLYITGLIKGKTQLLIFFFFLDPGFMSTESVTK